jgi:hypothetical protein
VCRDGTYKHLGDADGHGNDPYGSDDNNPYDSKERTKGQTVTEGLIDSKSSLLTVGRVLVFGE